MTDASQDELFHEGHTAQPVAWTRFLWMAYKTLFMRRILLNDKQGMFYERSLYERKIYPGIWRVFLIGDKSYFIYDFHL